VRKGIKKKGGGEGKKYRPVKGRGYTHLFPHRRGKKRASKKKEREPLPTCVQPSLLLAQPSPSMLSWGGGKKRKEREGGEEGATLQRGEKLSVLYRSPSPEGRRAPRNTRKKKKNMKKKKGKKRKKKLLPPRASCSSPERR